MRGSDLFETLLQIKAYGRRIFRVGGQPDRRTGMIAAAGHDLRTPMTRMRLRAEFIEDEAEREKWLADLAELDSIADSAIRLVREEAQEQDEAVSELRLDRLLDDIAGEQAALGYAVSRRDLPALSVRAAALALKRALRNLIINAATHGGGAELLLSQSGDRAEIAVLDRGPGIPADERELVFERFYRSTSARAMPGSGIGLAIVKQVVVKHGGKIRNDETVPGGQPPGTTFFVLLPGQPLPAETYPDDSAQSEIDKSNGHNGFSGGHSMGIRPGLPTAVSVHSQS